MRRRLPLFVAFALVVALTLAACSGSSKKSAAPAKKKAATATTKPPPPIAPLTGLPDPSGASLKRCAVTVKIDNTPATQPKYGVDQADVVYEEVVEGGITRLATIYNSNAPDRVGKVRSVRKTDQSIVWPIKGVFAYSGGAPYAIASISTAPVVRLDESSAGSMMFRDNEKRRPYNLNARVDQMYGACKSPAPPPLFTYRGAKTPVAGDPVESVRVGFQAGFATTWTWDAASGTWLRSIFGRPENTAAGVRLAPKNLVVMYAQYVGGDPNHGNEGAEAVLTGTGKLQVFSGGKVVTGTWSRPAKENPAQLLDANGTEIPLTPGQTWVELPEPNYQVAVTAPPPPPATTAP